MLEFQNVSKNFDNVKALANITCSFKSGDKVALLGANGSGKSTFLRIAATLLSADSGKISRTFPNSIRAKIAYSAQDSLLYTSLSIKENLQLYSSLLGLPVETEEILQQWSLSGVSNKPISTLSTGNRTKAGLARALLGNPYLRLLDEPTSSLNDQALGLLLSRLNMDADCITIIATHDISRLIPWANRAILISDGAIQADSELHTDKLEVHLKISKIVEYYRSSNK